MRGGMERGRGKGEVREGGEGKGRIEGEERGRRTKGENREEESEGLD